ncbi:MAG: hypothetical protein HYV17_10855 [Xanthomonadales bacterium]|nr:hypothetical protein [Xanthomonadales bacterium]
MSPGRLILLGAALLGTASAFSAELTIAEGVVVKFGSDAALVVRDRITTKERVVFTSLGDDAIAGQTASTAGVPAAGQWKGLSLLATATPDKVNIDRLNVRYAGAQGAAAIDLGSNAHQLDYVTVTDSTLGVRSSATATAAIVSGSTFLRNQTAVIGASANSIAVTQSELVGNTTFAVQNLAPGSAILARHNWWGHSSGPRDAVGNPSGLGDPVSAGVDYGTYASQQPLLDCRLATANGSYTTAVARVSLRLACRNAIEFRLSESSDFGNLAFSSIGDLVDFDLSSAAGTKMIYAQYRGASGQSITVQLPQQLNFQPSTPVVTITAPAAGATVSADVDIVASVSDSLSITGVEFFVDNHSIGLDAQAPYAMHWSIAGVADGSHQVKVVATNSEGRSGQAILGVSVLHPDPQPPVVSDFRFDGGPLAEGATLATPGTFSASVVDDRGIRSVQFRIDGGLVSGGSYTGGRYSVPLDFDAHANGSHSLQVTATDLGNNVVSTSRTVTLAIPSPAAPVIQSPLPNVVTQQASVGVSGRAAPASRVQLFVNDAAVGALATANVYGNFSVAVPLVEGANLISAEATSSRGTSPRSSAVPVSYTPSVPSIVLTAPAEGAMVVRSGPITVSANDPAGVARIEFFVDGQSLGSDTAAPFEQLWTLDGVSDGTHTVLVRAINNAGRSSELTRAVTVQKEPPPPPPFVAPYVSEIVSVSPATSFGTEPINISARIVDRNGAAMPGVTVRLILRVNGFERRFTLVSDANANIAYRFVPQGSDQGRYAISIVHPDETNYGEQAAFTINRLSAGVAAASISAARGFPQVFPITVTASPGDGATGVRLEALAAEQPSGALPAGISILPGSPIDLAAGRSGALSLTLASTAEAPETGTVILTLLADSSGATKRGSVRVDYRLYAPRPSLYPTPTFINGGVRQTQQLTQVLTVENKGLVPAVDVRVRLLDANQGSNVPSWIHLASASDIGVIEVGETKSIQLTSAPQADVQDGVYNVFLNVSSSNAQAGNIPVSIAVTQNGDGSVRFKAVDIFTNTLNASGQTIEGLAGATFRLQNEAVSTVRGQGVSNAQGEVTIGPLPAGRYSYRATATNHSEATGRVLIQPGATIDERTFLDFSAVSVEWSVVETTVQDHYDVVLTATYQTQVPAPVVLIEPMSINLPDMQVGEEITGVMTVTNYGLVRADRVVFTPPTSDEYFRVEVMGSVPNALEAKQRVSLPFKITALAPLPGTGTSNPQSALNAWLGGKQQAQSKSMEFCAAYSLSSAIEYWFQCLAGDWRPGTGGNSFNKMYGAMCITGIDVGYHTPRCINGNESCPGGAGWNGRLAAYPAPTLPSCAPDGPCPGAPGGGGGE